ncbi:alpha/beta hydrolase [Peptoniphilus genitalis]|uniref:alpha/beta hydrolase n=1 Tax=Peptoniphilus genitalis TaxID=3036303 RepID=UPI0024AE7BA3|nr:alpha/beta hydrolase [Peptoniphilus sp. Marseille-Q7072]
MVYFIILLVLVILLIPQIYYRKSNKLLQNDGVDLTCDLEFINEVVKNDNFLDFGNERDFYELTNFEKVKIKSYDGFVLDGGYFPVKDPKALVQIIHGALEHKERYYYLIKYLNERGYSCFISDNRGHGRSLGDKYTVGYIDGVEKVVDDNLAITRELKKKFPETDIYLIGHSLGTVFGRIYLEEGDDLIKKIVLSGPPNYVPEVPLAIFLGNFINFYFGEQRTIYILKKLYTGDKKHFDWLSYSKENIRDAEKDPDMPPVFKNRGYLAVFEGVGELKNTKNYKFRNPDLDIFIIAGEDDVVIGGEKGFESSIHLLREVGYKNIKSKLYKKMKHEIFREKEREEVFKDIVDFLEK